MGFVADIIMFKTSKMSRERFLMACFLLSYIYKYFYVYVTSREFSQTRLIYHFGTLKVTHADWFN